jgi:hypothetical protein
MDLVALKELFKPFVKMPKKLLEVSEKEADKDQKQ